MRLLLVLLRLTASLLARSASSRDKSALLRLVSTVVFPGAIPTSHHARLPLLADALRALQAFGYDAAE